MTDRTYPEAHESVFVGGPTSQPRKPLAQSLAEVSEPERWARLCEALDAIADDRSRTTKLFRELCTVLRLDKEIATTDDVLRFVGELSYRAQEAERLRELLERMREKRLRCVRVARHWREQFGSVIRASFGMQCASLFLRSFRDKETIG